MNIPLKDNTLLKKQCYINGQWMDSDSETTIEVTNPYDGELLAEIPLLSEKQVKEAIHFAHQAFYLWKNIHAMQRADLLRKWLDLVLENIMDLATIMVLEQGKPLKEAIGEIKYAASYIEFYAEEAKRIYGDILPSPFPQSRVFVIKQAVGVVGIITPWNFPAAMMVRKIAPALAAGCTCVIKPDEKTPLSGFAMIELAHRAGIPKGVLNIVTGIPAEIGKVFTSSSLMRKISFTGSTRVGKILMRDSADQVKRLSLELGGNAPFIVFDDANIADAIEGVMVAKFRNAGQTCVCANRIFVHEAVFDEFTIGLKEAMDQLRVGNGMDEVDVGPLINQEAIDKVERLLADAQGKGARIDAGGKKHPLGGTFFEPTIITDIRPNMEIFDEEIFGPIASIVKFKTEAEVISLANNTKFGLASYFYAQNMAKIWRVAEALEYGMVGINRGAISSAYVPFGGIKESGMGREGSKYGIEDYLNVKYVCMGE